MNHFANGRSHSQHRRTTCRTSRGLRPAWPRTPRDPSRLRRTARGRLRARALTKSGGGGNVRSSARSASIAASESAMTLTLRGRDYSLARLRLLGRGRLLRRRAFRGCGRRRRWAATERIRRPCETVVKSRAWPECIRKQDVARRVRTTAALPSDARRVGVRAQTERVGRDHADQRVQREAELVTSRRAALQRRPRSSSAPARVPWSG